jgi:hypothetical protein
MGFGNGWIYIGNEKSSEPFESHEIFKLYITKDAGKTWNLVSDDVYAFQFDWGDAGTNDVPVDRIYFVEYSSSDTWPNFIQLDYESHMSSIVQVIYCISILYHIFLLGKLLRFSLFESICLCPYGKPLH